MQSTVRRFSQPYYYLDPKIYTDSESETSSVKDLKEKEKDKKYLQRTYKKILLHYIQIYHLCLIVLNLLG